MVNDIITNYTTNKTISHNVVTSHILNIVQSTQNAYRNW